MARPRKTGIDYFELDCQIDERIRLIQAEFGLKGFAVVVKLFQKIYGEQGYYCEWDEERQFLFMAENAVSSDCKNLIESVIFACVRRGIFSQDKFNKYGILTSEEIQKKYLNATTKRELVEVKKEYLLISDGIKNKNVVINSISDGRNSINSVRNTQSRVEKSRVEKSIKYISAKAPCIYVKEESDNERDTSTFAICENERKKRRNNKEVYFEQSEELDNIFKEYIDMRKKIKKPMTDRAIQLSIKKLHELATKGDIFNVPLAISIVEQTIFHNWLGLFPLKSESKTSTVKKNSFAMLDERKEEDFESQANQKLLNKLNFIK